MKTTRDSSQGPPWWPAGGAGGAGRHIVFGRSPPPIRPAVAIVHAAGTCTMEPRNRSCGHHCDLIPARSTGFSCDMMSAAVLAMRCIAACHSTPEAALRLISSCHGSGGSRVAEGGRRGLWAALWYLNEFWANAFGPVVQEADGVPGVAGAARPPDAVDVVVDPGGHVILDDMRHIRDVQPPRRDVGGYQHRNLPRLKGCQGLLPLVLRPFPMNGVGGDAGLHTNTRRT